MSPQARVAQQRPVARPGLPQRPIARPGLVPTPTSAQPVLVRKAVPAFTIGPVKPVGERFINVMVYGPYGHGKTTFAASAEGEASMRDVLFINAESGDMSLTGHRSLDIITINKYDQLARIFEFLTLHCRLRDSGETGRLLELERELKASPVSVEDQTGTPDPNRTWFEEQRLRTGKPMGEPYLYRTVVLDSISELHKYLIYKFTGVDIGRTKLDEEIEKMEEWQPAQELFRLLIRSFRDLPMNSIFVAAESIEPDRRNKVRNPHAGQSLPKLAGQMAGDVAGFIDIVGYLVREITGGETHRYLYLGAGYEGWISKHRFENLPNLEYVEDPTLSSLIDLARKDAEHNGASQSNTGTAVRAVTPSHHATGASASNASHEPNSRRHAPNSSTRAGRGGATLRG